MVSYGVPQGPEMDPVLNLLPNFPLRLDPHLAVESVKKEVKQSYGTP